MDAVEYKQVILIRKDLNLPKGKMAAQSAHAAVDAVLKSLKSNEKIVKKWRFMGMKKIALSVKDEKELHKYVQEAKDIGLITSVITDAGKTIVAPGTITCAAIGPYIEEEIDSITGNLKIV